MKHTVWILLLLAMACDPESGEDNRTNPGTELMELAVSKDSLPSEAAVEDSGWQEEKGELEQRLIAAGLVNIQEIIPEVRVELKYATTDNFFGKNVYGPLSRCYMQPEVAGMLEEAFQELSVRYPELTFLVYDAVRPQSVQQILWDELDKPDSLKPLYVADPKRGSLHNFGVAIDLTLASKETGDPLDMGTGYDYFGYPAYPDREDQMLEEGRISEEQVANRKILREVMKKAGFTGIGSEWWHFNAYSRKVAGEKFDIVK